MLIKENRFVDLQFILCLMEKDFIDWEVSIFLRNFRFA